MPGGWTRACTGHFQRCALVWCKRMSEVSRYCFCPIWVPLFPAMLSGFMWRRSGKARKPGGQATWPAVSVLQLGSSDGQSGVVCAPASHDWFFLFPVTVSVGNNMSSSCLQWLYCTVYFAVQCKSGCLVYVQSSEKERQAPFTAAASETIAVTLRKDCASDTDALFLHGSACKFIEPTWNIDCTLWTFTSRSN